MENCLQIIWQSVYDYSQHNQYDEAFIICSWNLAEYLHLHMNNLWNVFIYNLRLNNLQNVYIYNLRLNNLQNVCEHLCLYE